MSVHYRFKSALEYDTITFDGLHISVKDLKNAIMQQKRIGKNTDFDLRITNAQTQEVYEDENTLIPKNTSLLVARVPVLAPKQKQWEGYGGGNSPPPKVDEGGPVGKAVDLANLDAPEDDKIKAMMSQSTQDYDPSNYVKIRGANQVGPVPPNYRCYKCHQNGHWIKDCPLGQGADPVEIKKSTGIPHSFMVPVDGPQVPGAMMMSNGQYAVPALDLQAYNQKSAGPAPVQDPKPEIPEDLLCSICSDLLTDAVMIPCCGNSFCDECIRSMLLESEEHECPDCHEKDISPATLIPNRFLRKSVANFKNTTGYEKKPVYKPKVEIPKEEPPKKEEPQAADSTEADNVKTEEKAVISEADSTEHPKSEPDFTKDPDLVPPKTEDPEGPPGVSPKHSPVRHITSKVSRDREIRDNVRDHRSSKNHRQRSVSPRRSHRHRKSPNYDSMHSDERQGTPIRDEPPGVGTNYIPPRAPDSYSTPPPGTIMGPVAPNLQAPPPNVPPFAPGTFPPVQGPPPNFRLPPPGPQPYLPPGSYPVPPRPVFDPALGGPPGGFGPNYRSRDYPSRRGGRERTPPGVIDDPLTAFNRIIREKDEKRARQLRLARRSWSRSRSRSFSRSPPPPASFRRRSRSPRRRSRSRSFSMSRSRSRSFSKSPRGSPLPSRRSPLPARRGVAARFHSPLRSPSHRRRNDYDRGDYERSGYRDKPRGRRADSRDRFYDDRDRDRDYDRTQRTRPTMASQSQMPQWTGPSHYQDQGYQNRYQPPPQVDQRKFEDIGPPGVEQPPVPGLEPELPPVSDFEKNRPARTPERREKDKNKERRTSPKPNIDREKKRRREEKRSRTRSRSPQHWRNPSPKPNKETTPEKPKKRRNSSEAKEDKKRHSDEERRKSKDKRKHRDKKEDKKKKKDKRDKHKSKDRKDKKEEFKQVIPKNDEGSNEVRKKIDDRKKQREEEEARKLKEEQERKERAQEEEKEREAKRLAEERKKEERRLRFLEDEKRKREEEAKKEELKKKQIEEARKALEEEERLRQEQEKKEEKNEGLYDEVIPEAEAEKEIRTQEIEEGEVVAEETPLHKEVEEEDSGILELHSMDMDIKMDDSDILAPLPEKSKWEVDEDGQLQSSPSEVKDLSGDLKAQKVSNEVLKRAENVIFARAINSIRPPIEIKKISGDRAKLYADETKEPEEKTTTTPTEKPRLSVKDRLGVKVDDPEPRVVRRIEIEAGSHQRRHRHDSERRKPKRDERNRRSRRDDDRKERRRRSSSSEPKKRKKDTKKSTKKDKTKKTEEAEAKEPEKKPKPATEKRKPTLDEANFEPDYDLELHDEEVETAVDKETKSDSSSAESSSSSSDEEERRKKKRKKQQQKKRKRRETSSSESESSSESSDSAEERERRRKKHKKNKKKKKKSKHK